MCIEKEKENKQVKSKNNFTKNYEMINHLSTDRSIKEHFKKVKGIMTEQTKQWWIGLGKELEEDIESLE